MDPMRLLLSIPGLLIGLSFHEFAHAWVAVRFGDPTPRYQGRLTLDPRAHWDWFGALVFLLSGFRFAWARPVQVNVYRLRPRYWGELAVALAGIGMNTVLAVFFTILAGLLAGQTGQFAYYLRFTLQATALINLWLAIFNFLPIPPLDGWRFFSRVIPAFGRSKVAFYLDQFGMFALMLLLLLDQRGTILGILLLPFEVVIGGTVQAVSSFALNLLL